MKKLLICVVLLVSFTATTYSQAYTTAIGARLGKGIGLTLNQVFLPGWTAEGILTHRKGENLTHYALLAEHHRKLLGRRFNFFFGAGVQGGSYDSDINEDFEDPFGIAGIVGLDFTISRLNISFDFQPNYNLRGGQRDFSSDSALSLRYVLIKRIKIKKKKKADWKFWEKSDKKKKDKKKRKK